MNPLTKYELKKMIGTRRAVIILLGAFLLNLLFFFLGVQSQLHYSGNVRTLSGLDAIRYEQQIMGRLKGNLTDEYIAKIESRIKEIESNPENLEIDQDATKDKQKGMKKDGYTETEIAKMPSVMKLKDSVYVSQVDQYDFIESTIGIQELLPKTISALQAGNINYIYDKAPGLHNPNAPRPAGTPVEINKLLSMYQQVHIPYYNDYYNGWLNFCVDFSKFSAMILGAVIIILLSPAFSQEYGSNMDSLILASKYGKNKVITAKMRSAFFVTSGLYLFSAILNSVLYAAIYGLSGSNCNIQVYGMYMVSPYAITFLELYIITLCLGFIGMLFLSTITLFVSSKCKKSFISLVLSAAFLYIPAIDLSGVSLFADKIAKLFPINMINSSSLFGIGVLYNIFGKMVTQPIIMVSVAVAFSLIFLYAAYKTFQKHQVA